MRTELAVGIDVSAMELHVAIKAEKAVEVFANTAEGHRKLVSKLTKGNRRSRVVLEATGTYHLDVAIALSDADGCRVSVINPRAAKHFHQACGIRAKTDRVDAHALREYAARMAFVPWAKPEASHLEFRALVRYGQQLAKDKARLRTQIHAAGVSATTPSWVQEQLAQRCEMLVSQIEAVATELERFEHQHSIIEEHVERLNSAPGVGRVTAQRLVADFIMLDPTMTSKQITAWAGLDPRPKESGTSVNGRRAISRRGSSRIRAALYMSALTAARLPGPHNDFYTRLLETRSAKKKVALVAVMREAARRQLGNAPNENRLEGLYGFAQTQQT